MISVSQIRKKREEVKALKEVMEKKYKAWQAALDAVEKARLADANARMEHGQAVSTLKMMGEQFALNDEESYSQEKLDIIEQEEVLEIAIIDEETIPF